MKTICTQQDVVSMTGRHLVGGIRPEWADGGTYQFSDELGEIDATECMPAGSAVEGEYGALGLTVHVSRVCR